ncbi:MAG TPA: hypothetical protein VMM15_13940 [Bradyrhizobium sp.]|nr:hypothetical protein [Bradyrhizobium sp.]
MLRIFVLTLAMIFITAVFCADPAHAQATRTWVSGVGDDANPCSRTAPCKTFAGSISKTATGGEIDCLDSGGFGAVTITKSITIDCEPYIGGVLVAGTNGIVVNSGAGSAVTLRGLDFEGSGTGLVGINALSVGALHVQKCIIRDFKAGAAFGISFAPSVNGQLFVEDTVITENGTGATGGGIQVKPTGTATATATLIRVHIEANAAGFVADSTGSTGGISSTATESVSTGNSADGWLATGGVANVLFLDRSVGTNNGGTGAKANGSASVAVVITGSTLVRNQVGIANTAGAATFSNRTSMILSNFSSDGAAANFVGLN